jgi:hypothetical protein
MQDLNAERLVFLVGGWAVGLLRRRVSGRAAPLALLVRLRLRSGRSSSSLLVRLRLRSGRSWVSLSATASQVGPPL